MIKNTFKSSAEPRYEAPAVAVFIIENEGVLCSSTEEFEKEFDWSDWWGEE